MKAPPFKKRNWEYITGIKKQKIVFDMTAQIKENNRVISTGVVKIDNKFAGTINVVTNDFFSHKSKTKKSPKMSAYALAHHFAREHFTNNNISMADDLLIDAFELYGKVRESVTADFRKARRKYAPSINNCIELVLIGSSFKNSGIALIYEPEKLKETNKEITYKGRGCFWPDENLHCSSGIIKINATLGE